MRINSFRLTLYCFAFCFNIAGILSCSSENKHSKEYKEERESEEHEERDEEEGEEEEEETGADKQLSSWFWQKAYPDPSNLTQKYQDAWGEFTAIKNRVPNGHNNRPLGMGNWSFVGPYAFGGRILSLAINPSVNAAGKRTIFAGSSSGGIWKTYVSGVGASAWEHVATGKQVLGVASIIYHPSDSNILLAGTGEVYRVETYSSSPYSTDQVSNLGRNTWKARGTYGVGILRSANAGFTWTQVLVKTQSDLFGIQKIKFEPGSSTVVYACATDGLYKSTDAGVNWSVIWSGTFCNDIIINPSNTQQIVIAAGNVTNNPKGVWRSTNGGTSFTQVTAGGFPTEAQYKGATKFSLLGTGPYTIIASVGVGDINNDGTYNEQEVYRSDDFGSTWSACTNSTHAKWQSWFSHGVTGYPSATNKLFMYGVTKHVLTLTGTTGTVTNIGAGAASTSYLTNGDQEGATDYIHADVHAVEFVPGSTTTAYWATDGGVFRTTNADASPISNMTFESCNGGLNAQQFFPAIAQSQVSASLVIGGLQDNGVIRYNGTGWAKVISGDGGPSAFKPDDETIILSSTDTRGVKRSTNTGTTYPTQVLTYMGNIPGGHDDRTSFCSPLVVSPNNSSKWYAGSDNIHVSTDAGITFNNNDGAGTPQTAYIEALHKPAIAIAVSPSDNTKLYVSVSPFSQNLLTDALYYNPPANIRKSTNSGGSFSTVTGTLPDRIVTDFAISSTFDDSIFVTLGGFNTSHIYVSGDGGGTWTPRSTGLPNLPFNSILIDAVDPKILYAGCDFGVYVSNDRGANWYDFNNGFWDATLVMDLVAAPGNKIRAATHGKGIFEASRWDGLVTLPVTITSFTGLNRGVFNELKWNTEDEYNLSHYDLERSMDGYTFSRIQKIDARNSMAPSSYSYRDQLGSNPAPIYYYRLKSVNIDGSYAYSGIIMIRISSLGKFEVLGNPFVQSISVRYSVPQTGPVEFQLLDTKGSLLRKEKTIAGAGPGNYTMNGLSALPPGIYLLNIDMLENRTVFKVVKR
ncbi:MAG TPA: hypothetical protein VLJ68_10440 [Chitinophagaceae bacterium]|nr:hypothetical protein [Chitinophagaceae bacterium]